MLAELTLGLPELAQKKPGQEPNCNHDQKNSDAGSYQALRFLGERRAAAGSRRGGGLQQRFLVEEAEPEDRVLVVHKHVNLAMRPL